ncbi:retrovirus-related pol polyprotein from transposon TNT 1-94 [Tanacetum coccineum]
MSGDSSNTDSPLPLSTVLHMLTIRLSSTNYLLWHKQMIPLLAYQKLTGYVDGSIPQPSPSVTTGETSSPNPAYASWIAADQRALILIQSSLSEEAMAETLGHTTSHAVWSALEDTYRMILLSAIGHPLDEDDKSHWFLCGLGSSFETFSTTQRLITPRPKFRDLVSQAESHEMFLQSVNDSTVTPVAFKTTSSHATNDSSSSRGRGRSYSRGSSNRGRGRGNRRPPHCQLCRKDGHYANRCPDLHTFARHPSSLDANLAEAFQAQCNTSAPDWFVDTGASAHMTSDSAHLDAAASYSGNESVIFGNGNSASISHIGRSYISPNISLLDVLVVPKLTKSLLSVSKLTQDNQVDVVFSDPMFFIQNRHSKETLAQGRRRNGLYVLEQGQQAFLAKLSSKRIQASFELWHSRLGHVSHDIISVLNKLGCLSVTSILPNPRICSSCQLSKSKRLSFDLNLKRSLHVLDLIHCDLWGPSPVMSVDGFRYYAIFVDDYSRFTWFYPMKAKSDFYNVFVAFVALVQTQFSCKIKVFQSDGGTEFTNNQVRTLLSNNGTHHQLSCPYTPQQNGRAERKHRHITETGLAIMFNAHVPAIFWTHAFSSAAYIINRLPTKLLDNKSPYELLFSSKPNYGNFRVFGCCVFPYLRDYSSHKLAPRSAPCVFIGYSSQYKGYKCLDLSTKRVYTTRHAQFDETSFPFKGHQSTASSGMILLSTYCDDYPMSISPSTPLPPSTTSHPPAHTPPCELCTDPPPHAPSVASPTHTDQPPPSPHVAPSQASTSGHPMVTRSKDGIFMRRHFADLSHVSASALHQALFTTKEPKGFKSAAKDPKWFAAMCDEMKALKLNATWDLVPRPTKSNIVGSKWVFRTKFLADGTIDKFKARLVAQGFTQVPGLDYSSTFWLSRLLQFELFSLLRCSTNGLFTNLTLKTLS